MNDHNEQTTIMLVDDTPANLELLRAMLHKKGYKVLVFLAENRRSARSKGKEPDLILLDIMMPEMNGFEVCGRLKKDERLREIPVIFISALDDTQSKVRAFTAGGVDYVTKPFQPEDLASADARYAAAGMRRELEKHMSELERACQGEGAGDLRLRRWRQSMRCRSWQSTGTTRPGGTSRRTRELCAARRKAPPETLATPSLIDDAFVENIYHASPLHDIGKVGIPDAILLKPGKLTRRSSDHQAAPAHRGDDR